MSFDVCAKLYTESRGRLGNRLTMTPHLRLIQQKGWLGYIVNVLAHIELAQGVHVRIISRRNQHDFLIAFGGAVLSEGGIDEQDGKGSVWY